MRRLLRLAFLVPALALAGEWQQDATRIERISVPMTLDATTQVGMTVCTDESKATCTGNCASPCASGSEKPIGVYWGLTAGTAHASTLYSIVVAGFTYTIPEEDHAAIALGDVEVTATGVGGYIEASATVNPVTHNQELGHALVAEDKYTFSGTTDVDADTEIITLDSDPTTWAVGDPVVYWDSADAAAVGGLTDGSVYWIVYKSGANVKLAGTKGGAVINLSDGDGTTMYLQRLVLSIIHWN